MVKMRQRTVMRSATKSAQVSPPVKIMPVPDFKTYCAILDGARAGRFALTLAETAMSEHVKQAASDLRATGKTTFGS